MADWNFVLYTTQPLKLGATTATKSSLLKCDKILASTERLDEHEGMYCQKRILNCVICDESFSQFNDLRKHKKIHNRKEFSCPICSKSFKDFRELSNHKDEDICISKEQKAPHPLEKPFSYSECDKRFSK